MFFSQPGQHQAWDSPSGGMRNGLREQRQGRRGNRIGPPPNHLGMPGQPRPRDHTGAQPGPVPLDTMKVQLQALQLEDPATVFIARRINKLGFSSSDALRDYFSKYGQVTSIHVSHSRVKNLRPVSDRGADAQWRLRPAALGFVVMSSAEATARILEDGPEHCVKGVPVRTQPFHHQPPDANQNNQEANVANINSEGLLANVRQNDNVNAEEDDYVTWAKGQPRSLSPGSDTFDTGTFDRSPDSGGGRSSTRSTSGEEAGGAAAFLQEVARARRLEEAGMYLQTHQQPPFNQQLPKMQSGVDVRKAVENEMEMLYNNFVISGGPIVYNASD